MESEKLLLCCSLLLMCLILNLFTFYVVGLGERTAPQGPGFTFIVIEKVLMGIVVLQ